MGSFNCERYSSGNCYPATAVPHGMNLFTFKSTSLDERWFYSPLDRSIEGFMLTHLPSPWLSDYGRLIIWGERETPTAKLPYYSSYNPDTAVSEPAYMKAFFERDRYLLELTPTCNSAILKYTFDDEGTRCRAVFRAQDMTYKFYEEENILYITTDKHVKVHDDGGNYKTVALREHIILKPSVPCVAEATPNGVSLVTSATSFEIRLSTSYISEEQARLNFAREVEFAEFDTVRGICENEWNEYLSKIEIEDEDEEKKKTFYSCMYRAFLWPSKFYETDRDGNDIHVNTATGGVAKGKLYTNNGFWDTFRTLYPYLSLIDTKLYADATEGFYNYYVDTGWLPKWVCPNNVNCMPGMLVEATLADAIVKDIVPTELSEKILSAMLKDGECESEFSGEGRIGLSLYRKYGYLPYTQVKESVNETLDNSFGDFAIAMAAKKLGKTDIADRYFTYAKNYENLFDKETGFMRGKDEHGSFRKEEFDPYRWGRDYTEGSAWQNSFGVYHDIEGLDRLFDGKLCDKIDELMAAPPYYHVGEYGRVIHEMAEVTAANFGQCAISNQPSFHIPYIYSELGHPEKTAYHTERLAKLFNSGVEGYPGDEDNGSASAWYILTAMGLYQMAPSRPDFSVSVPLFNKMTVKLANGNTLVIEKSEYDTSNMRGRVSYSDVMKGGRLSDIVMKKKS